jgi:hypothetical protein
MPNTSNGERQALLQKKVDSRAAISAEGKAKDELLDQHGSSVLHFSFTQAIAESK